jgi:phage antirepressor YoqD-like protein
MSSGNLLELVNNARRSAGEKPVRHNDFVSRCADELEGEHYETFVVENPNGTQTNYIKLTVDQCKLVAMRESKAVRRAVLSRLNEMDGQQAIKVPTTLSGALRLAADQAEQIEAQQLLIEQQKPAVEFVDSYVQAEGLMGFRQVAKLLGAGERKFRQMLLDESVMYYLGGQLTPMAPHIKAGRFEVKTGEADNGHAFTSAKFTPKGVEYVSRLWRAAQ